MALTTKEIQEAYVTFFNRPADVDGLNYWTTYAGSQADLYATFAQSKEYNDIFAGMSQSAQVNAVYKNLFGRDAEPAGLTYWTNLLANGSVSLAGLARTVATGSQGTDKSTFDNRVTASTAFTKELDTTAEMLAYQGAGANAVAKQWLSGVKDTAASLDAAIAPSAIKNAVTSMQNAQSGQTYNLTVGADNFVGTNGNDVFNVVNVNASGALASTAQAFDSVDGGEGTADTLNWYATGGQNTTIQGTYKNLEIVNIYGANELGGTTFDASKIGGSKEVWLQSNAGAVSVTGLSGKTLGVAGNTTGMQTGDFGATATTASLALNAAAGAAGAGNAAVTITGASVATLAVAGAGKATITPTTAAVLKTVTVAATGATTLDLNAANALTTVDASASTSNVTLTGLAATLTSIKTGTGKDTFAVNSLVKVAVESGAGDDSVTLDAVLVAGSKVNLGAGNDKLLGTAIPVAGAELDGGEGFDTVSGALINVGNGASFKNFEAIDFAGMSATALDSVLLTGSTIQKLTVSGAIAGAAATATIQNVAQTVGLEYTGANALKTIVVAAKDVATGTADAFTVTLANSATIAAAPTADNFAAGSVSLAGIETVNVVSGGTNSWNSLTVGTAAADFNNTQKIVVTGASNLDLTIGAAQTLVGAATSVALTSVDASAATGKITINTANNSAANGAVKLLGGSGADTFVITNGGAAVEAGTTYTIVGGAGADTVNVAGAVYGTVAAAGAVGKNITVVEGAATGDKLIFSGSTAFGGTAQAKANVSAATTLLDALNIAAAGTTGDNIAWFNYGGDTYVVEDNNAATTLNAVDIVVKLTGTIDLSTAAFAANTITLA